MTDQTEIFSFVKKYLDLLRSGHDAELSLKCKAGKASLQLNVGLLPPVPQSAFPKRRRPGPSRLRRRERRAQKRAELQAASIDRENVDTSAVQPPVLHPSSVAEEATKGLILPPTFAEIAVQAVLKPSNADAAVQAAVFHLYQADVAVQATAEKSRISPNKTSKVVQPVATQPPIRAHHRGYQVQDEVCQDI